MMSQEIPASSDSPQHSSVTDEGDRRPSRVSVVVGVVIAVGVAAVIVATSRLPAAAVAALAGLVTGGLVVLVTAHRYRLVKRLCASVLLFVSGLLLLGSAGLVFQSVRGDVSAIQSPVTVLQQPSLIGQLLIVTGVGIALCGAAVTGKGSLRLTHFTSTVSFGLLTISLPLVGFGFFGTIELVERVLDLEGIVATTGDVLLGHSGSGSIGYLLGYLGSGSIDYLGLTVAWGLGLVSITVIRVGISHLPITELAPPSRREEVTTYLTQIQAGLYKLRFLVFVAPAGVLLIEAVRTNESIPLTDAYLQVLSMLGTLSSLRLVLLGSIVFGIVTVILARSTKQLARLNRRQSARRLLPVGTGLVVSIVSVQFSSDILNLVISGPGAEYRAPVQSLLSQYGTVTLILAVLVIVGAIPIMLYLGLLTIDYSLLPKQTDGAALLSVGLFITAVGSLLYSRSPLVGFIGVAGSFLAWDLTTNAVSLGQEIGRYAPTRQAELVHTGGSLIVAGLGVIVAMTALVLTRTVSPPPENVASIAAVISITGLFVLIFSLRGS